MNDEMSVNEAAHELGLTSWTVRNMCRLGKIPAHRRRNSVGRAWLIPRQYIAEMAKDNDLPNAAYLEWEREHGKIPTTQPTP